MRSIPDRLMEMSRPPCEDCGTPRILLVRKHDSSYRCPDCETEITVTEGIDLLTHLNRTPAYHGSLLIDPEVRDACRHAAPAPSWDYTPETACPNCDTPMIQRHGKHGTFLGCPHYPDCKGTRPYRKREA